MCGKSLDSVASVLSFSQRAVWFCEKASSWIIRTVYVAEDLSAWIITLLKKKPLTEVDKQYQLVLQRCTIMRSQFRKHEVDWEGE